MHGSGGRSLLTTLALTAAAVLTGSITAGATTTYGHVGAADGTLRPGCHPYRYHYVAEPPSHDWFLETWLHDPRGRPRGSGDFASGSDPRRGHGRFGICRSTVVPGRFTIRARLSWYTAGLLPGDPPVRHTRWFEPAYVRLHG